jgi:hypothetical protein
MTLVRQERGCRPALAANVETLDWLNVFLGFYGDGNTNRRKMEQI